MGENLVIVESPAKAVTIEKFLGKGFKVMSSYGHIRDLSDKKLGINIENGFEPVYEVSKDKKKVVSELSAAAKKADIVWIASDEDREGEAIAWHLFETLKLDPAKTRRIVFHEITKDAILNAIKNPRDIDLNLVMAQQARRVLDRLVGFELSPVLWKKVQPKLSAGRVQSVALRLIVDREREIAAFSAEKYFKVEACFAVSGHKSLLKAQLDRKFASEEQAREFLELCKSASFHISSVEKKEGTRGPAAPFTTSALQQEAARKLGFSVSQTMSVAQSLYERGLITYMRTDSTNLSNLALGAAKATITELYGSPYARTRNFHTKVKGAQEAHEAIRPTYISNLEIEGSAQEKRLYTLIWKRTVASQMADARIEKTTVTIESDKFREKFEAQGEIVLFDGFLKVYIEGKDDEEDETTVRLPNLKEGSILNAQTISAEEKYSQKPPRYSEASLVRKLEELGIGRPSTYAPTISTIIKRGYIIKGDKDGSTREICLLTLSEGNITRKVKSETVGAEKKKLLPENIGMIVTDFLSKYFADILDYGFTAKVEEDFDKIAEGKAKWNKLIEMFYGPFIDEIKKAIGETEYPGGARELGKDPESGKTIIVRMGKFGPLVQKGSNDDPEKEFVALPKGQLIEAITLEEALSLFSLPKLPRSIGTYNGKEMMAAKGKFGPYIKFDGKFISMGKKYDPFTITEEQAIALIEEKEKKSLPLADFKSSGIQVLNGRYGAYIKCDGNNYRIPKGANPEKLTEEDCKEIIARSQEKKK